MLGELDTTDDARDVLVGFLAELAAFADGPVPRPSPALARRLAVRRARRTVQACVRRAQP